MEGVFLYLLGRSGPAAVVIAVVVLLRFALRDAPKAFRMLLWAVVALRLLCPYTPESRLGLMPDAAPVYFDLPENIARPDTEPGTAAVLPEAVPYPVAHTQVSETPRASVWTLTQILSGVWLAGFCALLLWGLCGYLKLRRTVAASLALSGGVYVCDDIPSPFVLGIVRPRVYVPSGLDGDELPCVLAHERAHIRRGDPFWKLCAWLTACLYWFHPLVWVSYVLFCRDVELACDEAAIRDMDAPRRAAYSEALLNRGLRRRKLQVYPLAFGENGVKERVRAVLRYRKPALWLTGAAVVVCVAAGVCLLTRPVSADKTPVEQSDAEAALLNVDGAELSALSGDVYEWVRNDADANWPNLTETLQIAEFPGVTFRWTPERVTATVDGEESVLFYGMPVWSVYLADLNGDGYPEFCSMVSFGSGFIDERINVYDYRNGRLSELQGRFYFNYTLSLENGTLTARQWKSRDIEPYSGPLLTGTLRLTDTGKLLLVPSNPDAVGTVTRVGETLSDELGDAVRAAVIAHDKPLYASGEFDAESHIVLAIRSAPVSEREQNAEAVPTVTLYLMSLRESFDYRDGSFERVSGRSGPLVLTFRMEDGGAVLSDYWEPRDGSYYWPDIREKFPSVLTDAQLDTQTYILGQNQQIYQQVVEHWNIDTTPIIEALFDELMSEPSASSNPGDYLAAHPLALRELLYYDGYTCAYIDTNIGEANGLRGALMRLVLQRLRGSTGSLSDLGALSCATLTHMQNHTGPEPGTYTLTDTEKLAALAALLKQAEGVTATGCPFEDVLTLVDEYGESVQLMMAADSCAFYRHGGQYYKYGSDNAAFYAFFG